MRTSPLWLIVLALFCLPAAAQSTAAAPASGRMEVDRHAALLEVVPPAAIQQSPAAVDLIDRLMRKHVLLLQHPSLIAQVLSGEGGRKLRLAKEDPDKLADAIRIRVIPDTNMIELSVDPAVAGEESVKLAEALVDTHLQNQAITLQNAQLERSVMLNNLKQRYQFRKDELGRDLREKAVRLSIDGMGAPGRLSAKEVELQQLLTLRFELERKRTEVAPDAVKAIDAQLKQTLERIDATKADLGDLTNQMNQYLTIKDDETTTRELLKAVNEQLEQISHHLNASPPEVRWLCRPSRG